MIEFVTGLPGAGKGVFTMLRIIDELQTTQRPIVTNFAVRLNPWVRKLAKNRSRGEKGLLAHLQDAYGTTFNAENRIHVVEDEQIANFYLWRVGEDGRLFKVAPKLDQKGSIVDFDVEQFANSVPTFYVVDEAWKFWNARAWQKADAGFQAYNAQHRKVGDDLLITAQSESQIDKQMRVLVQEYHSLVNHKFRRLWAFRQPDMITVMSGPEPPEQRRKGGGNFPKKILFDKVGLGGSFDTAAGAGRLQCVGADLEKKTKGLPFWLIFVLIAVGSLAFVAVVHVVSKVGASAVKLNMPERKNAAVNGVVSASPDAGANVHLTKLESAADTSAVVTNAVSSSLVERLPEVLAWAVESGKLRVLVEGVPENRWFCAGDGHLTEFDEKTGVAVVDGERLPVRGRGAVKRVPIDSAASVGGAFGSRPGRRRQFVGSDWYSVSGL